MNNTVALEKCSAYEFDQVYAAVNKLMDLCPPPDVKDKTVLVKPNMLSPKKPEAAVCTHPVVVGAVVKAFVSRGAKKVIVGESPATANSTACAKIVGTYDEVVNNGGEWHPFDESISVLCPEGRIVKQFEIAKPFIEADVVVSVSKLKTHQLMSYTGAMKNLFGLVVGLKKAQTHFRFPGKTDFANYIVDLNVAAECDYAVMDAVVGMEGPGGPGNGDPVKLGFLAASCNVLAIDWICSSIVGYDPHNVAILEAALQRGKWLNNENEIVTAGVSPSELKPSSFRIVKDTMTLRQARFIPRWLYDAATPFMRKSPAFTKSECINCGKCVEICPPQVLTLVPYKDGKQKVQINREKCIHCFCCHEVCPVNAIKLRIMMFTK